MENKAKNKRDIIKNILIIFLIVMLLLTFFSNTIMNRSLPEVSTQYPNYKQINSKIRASATVSANKDYSLVSDEAREIAEVHISRGDKVERGQVLFTLVENESSTLSDAVKALNELLIQKQQMLMDDTSTDSGTDYEYEIEKLNDTIAEAKAKLEAIPGYDASLETLENELEALEEALEVPKDELERIKAKMSALGVTTYDTEDEVKAEIEENKALYETALKKYEESKGEYADIDEAIETLKTEQKNINKEKKAYNEKISEYDELISEATKKKSEYEEKVGATISSNENLTKLESALNTARSELRAMEREYEYFQTMQSAKSDLDRLNSLPTATPENIAEAERTYKEAKERYDDITGGVTRTEGQYLELIDALELAEKDALALYNDASSSKKSTSAYESKINSFKREIEKYEESKSEIEKSIKKLDERLEEIADEISELNEGDSKRSELKTKLDDAESDYKKSQNKLEYLKLDAEADALEDKIKADEKVYSKKKAELDELKLDAPDDAKTLEKQIKEAEKSIETYERKLEAEEKNEPYNDEIKRLKLENLNEQISRQEKEITRIKEKLTNTEITSPVSGTVTSLSYTAGEEIEAGSTVATIAINEKGFTMEFSATNEQCQQIKIGDKADVSGYYWGDKPEIVVSAFKNDSSNPGRGKIVVLSITGEDVTAGQSITFTLGDKSRSYDKVVPSSAVREDSNGKFVLVVESKSTPLGNRYIARRVAVEVIASDDTSSALSGEIEYGEFVITTSSAPVSDGMQVRLADKN